MLASSIGQILFVSGILTAAAGLASVLFSAWIAAHIMFFTRHWGPLLFSICSLTVYAGLVPNARPPILIAAIVEKCIIFLLAFFGSVKRTTVLASIATTDGMLAVL